MQGPQRNTARRPGTRGLPQAEGVRLAVDNTAPDRLRGPRATMLALAICAVFWLVVLVWVFR